ncbi:MAG: DUF3365 domain-containing protein [Lentisphaeraceae bacterium]|nr:DUF3365 domain-containing protein [Lentisphaeraceae bacterium]
MRIKTFVASLLVATPLLFTSCSKPAEASAPAAAADSVAPEKMADALFAVMKGTRTAYTKHVIARLGKEKKLIKPHEKWEDKENGVMLPAQMFRYARDLAMEQNPGFTYSLQSEWPINSQNAPKTPKEKEGLQFIGKNPGKNFYGKETLGDKTFFTAVYPDVAVSAACIDCHNDHKDSPRDDFKMGEVMGGVVIRIPMK